MFGNLMYVVGAIYLEKFKEIWEIVLEYFLLVFGVGVQGGDFEVLICYGVNVDVGLLVNFFWGIIFVGEGEDFVEKVRSVV